MPTSPSNWPSKPTRRSTKSRAWSKKPPWSPSWPGPPSSPARRTSPVTAEARSAGLESLLDEEYRKKVPPFTAGEIRRSKRSQSRPGRFDGDCSPEGNARPAWRRMSPSTPCSRPTRQTELIGLQYHLHIPGPDPLTNKDSMARQQYYGDEIGGTPTVFFNGHRRGRRRRPDAALGTKIQGVSAKSSALNWKGPGRRQSICRPRGPETRSRSRPRPP